ncbi:hypothetical protein OEZ86_004804 [Tetradesmus obliquus]|nr:hypothetical protein OEZ86_004804 [Tetradesmus obliquus]
MSPIAGGGHGVPSRTPRSGSKQQGQQQQQGRGQTNISQFFPSLTDGNSRDSETASLQHHQQQQQQQQQPSPLKDTAGQQQQRPAARGATPPPAAAKAAGDGSMQQQQGKRSRGASGAAQGGSGGSDASQAAGGAAAWQQQLPALQQKHQQELEQARQEARQREGQLSDQLLASQRQIEALQGLLGAARSSSQEREGEVHAAVSQLVVQLAVAQGNLSRLQLSLDGSRLGCLGLARNGALGFAEVWEDGPVLRELAARKAALQRSREEVEAARKALKKRLPPPPKATLAAAAAAAAAADAAGVDAAASGSGSSAGASQYISSAEYVMQDEILKVRLSVLRREEELLSKEEERLGMDKMRHLRQLKRLRDEEGSRFQGQPLLNRRYVLAALLGRGGFSEVHKAYDTQSLKFVAVKIHQLNSTWSESRKASYVRHAVREYTIHKALAHTNIVSLSDIFEVDNTTFATVLELCEGGDLEAHLQQHHTLPEREARALIAQVFAGLAYLNRAPNSSSGAGGEAGFGPRVIHYDLKPANILFDSLGTVKITDFGLSKVVEDGQTMGMELTSQGAGTYWYLPPECFAAGNSSSNNTIAASRGAGGLLPPGILGSSAAAGAAAGGMGGVGMPAGAGAGPSAGAGGAPRISNKVDVWSAGVILYQMLYGKRPFGEGLTQEQIYRDGVMLNARQVQFPAKPSVSAEGRAFLSRCLAYNQEERWDVLTAAADPYLQLKR